MTRILVSILGLLFIVLQYDLWVGEGSLASLFQLQKSIEVQQQSNLRLQERNNALAAEVQDLKQGLSAVEERARSELGMIKQGETFLQVVEQPEAK